MPKNKFEDVIFTAVMAIVMVYGMIVYNVALNTGGTVSGFTFLAAVHELVFICLLYTSIKERDWPGNQTLSEGRAHGTQFIIDAADYKIIHYDFYGIYDCEGGYFKIRRQQGIFCHGSLFDRSLRYYECISGRIFSRKGQRTFSCICNISAAYACNASCSKFIGETSETE